MREYSFQVIKLSGFQVRPLAVHPRTYLQLDNLTT
jgi:hypothetical protein